MESGGEITDRLADTLWAEVKEGTGEETTGG